jgi:tryptophan synthase alpha subunit
MKTDIEVRISKPEHVSEIVGLGADGVIVGSGIVKRVHDRKEVARYAREMSAPTKNL